MAARGEQRSGDGNDAGGGRPDAAGGPAAALTTTQRGTLVATGVGLFMIFLDALIVNVALPEIQADFGGGESGLQWTVTAYSLAMAVSMMAFAALADRRGRRLVYSGGLVVFSVASLACGLAPSLLALDIARGVQGLGAAAVNVTSLALVSAAFQDKAAKARAIGIWSAIAAIGVAVGPTLGGVLTQSFGWRSVFVVNVPIGVIALVLTARFVAESRDPNDRGFDLAGQLLYVLTVGGLAFAVIEAPQSGWTSPPVAVAGLAFLVGLPLFIRRELHTPDPMMDVRLFTHRPYTLAIVTVFVVMFSAYGMLLVVNQLWQDVRNDTVLATGLRLLPLALVQIVLSPLAGRWVGRFGARQVMLAGLGALCLAFSLQLVGVFTGDGITVVGVAFVGAGLALTLTPATSVAMSSVPEERAGMASGIMSSQRALGSTAGYAVLGSVLAAWLSVTLGPSLRPVVPDDGQRHAVTDAVVGHADPRAVPAELPPPNQAHDAPPVSRQEVLVAAADDFRHGIAVALGIALLAVVLTFLADRRWIPREPAPGG